MIAALIQRMAEIAFLTLPAGVYFVARTLHDPGFVIGRLGLLEMNAITAIVDVGRPVKSRLAALVPIAEIRPGVVLYLEFAAAAGASVRLHALREEVTCVIAGNEDEQSDRSAVDRLFTREKFAEARAPVHKRLRRLVFTGHLPGAVVKP